MSRSLLLLFIEAYREESKKHGIVDGLCARFDDRGAPEGTEGALKALDVLNTQVHRNGFHGYLWNCEPVEWKRAAKGLELINDDIGGRLLKRANGVFFPLGPKSDPLAKRQQVDRLGQRQRAVLDRLDGDWYANRPKQEERIVDFCAKHVASLKAIEKPPHPARASLTWMSESTIDYQLYEEFFGAYKFHLHSFSSFGFEGEMLFSSARHFLCTSFHETKAILILPSHGAVAPQLLAMMGEIRRYLHLHLIIYGGGREAREDEVTFLANPAVPAIVSAVQAVAQVAK